MKEFLHLSNESGQWEHLQIKNIFLNGRLLTKIEITIIFGFTYYT